MPYIPSESRKSVLEKGPTTAGELNYLITAATHLYIQSNGGLNYGIVNEIVGVLECAKMELYRSLAAPYEDKKALENGNVSPLDETFFKTLDSSKES